MPQVTIMTRAYQPFIFGGKVEYNIKTTVEGDGPHDIGKGYKAYVIKTPKGKTRIAEATSGALIGPSLKAVIKDVAAGSAAIMKKQVGTAVKAAKKAKVLEPDEFWKMYEK